MNKSRKTGPMTVGTSSLLVIFAVLCLTVFALLSISTVEANRRLSDSAADAVLDYYKADRAAEEILARLRLGELPEGVMVQDGVYSYACPISETQTLMVSVSVEGSDYTVLRWQAVASAPWQSDDTLTVWDGGLENN